MKRIGRNEDGVSDIVGTIVLVAVTVSLVAATAPTVLEGVTEAAPVPPDLSYGVDAVAGSPTLGLRHLGGDPVLRSDLEVAVVVNGTQELARTQLGGAVPWKLGQFVDVNLSRPLLAGEWVEVLVASRSAGAAFPPVLTVATGPSAPSLGGAPAMQVSMLFRDDVDFVLTNTTSTLYLHAKVQHPDGRKAIQRVVANLSSVHGPNEALLHDDGTNGDLVAGDSTYSTYFLVPPHVPKGNLPISVSVRPTEGARIESMSELTVLEKLPLDPNAPYWNKTLMPKAGWNIIKNPTTNTITLRLKIHTVTDKVTINGVDYRLKNVYLEYRPFKPGDTGVWQGSVNSCTLPVALFTWSGGIQKYDVVADGLSYYLRTEWVAANGATYQSNIEASPPAQYLTLRATDVISNVGTTWTSYLDCTNLP